MHQKPPLRCTSTRQLLKFDFRKNEKLILTDIQSFKTQEVFQDLLPAKTLNGSGI